jgi:coproporphyrinogen III oxidase-like Fe-S oxidoreductase
MLLTAIMRMWLTRALEPFRFKGDYDNRLSFEDVDDLGLYVHIPFCRSLCSFCPYCKVVYEPETAAIYRMALLSEIDLVGRQLRQRKRAGSLYFGGGTPALMADDLEDIIDRLKQYFIITGGIGVELHPADITEENLDELKAAGVTMVSLGIQSFNRDCLSKLGRVGEGYARKLRTLGKAGFDVVDVDLIFAIPGQTEEMLIDDVDTAFSLGATQVSTYPFIDFTFADNDYRPLPAKEKKRMLQALVVHCRRKGKDRTSVWTFAEPQTQRYSSVTRDNFLGFGVSAATLLRSVFKINTFSVEGYIERIDSRELPTSLTLDFTERQRAAYFLFWSAYSMAVLPQRFEAVVGVPLSEMFGFEFWVLERLGMVYKENGCYRLTDYAACLYHNIEQIYTTAYIDKMWNISRNIAFPEEIVLR